MPTRNIVLTDHQAHFVERLVAYGHYQNASEVLREGLRMVEVREAENAARLVALREAVRVGVSDIDMGNFNNFISQDALGRHLASITIEVINAS